MELDHIDFQILRLLSKNARVHWELGLSFLLQPLSFSI